MTNINDAIAAMGAKWLKLRTKTDPPVNGLIITSETREKTFEGNVVLNRKTGQPRVEWVFTLQTTLKDDPDDDGTRKYAAVEAAQRAIAAAVKTSGGLIAPGGRLQVAVVEDPPTDRDQPTFKAKYTPPEPKAAHPSAAAVSPADVFGDDAPF